MRNTAVALLGALPLVAVPAFPQDAYVVVARGSAGLIRTYDNRVRDVAATIPAMPGAMTACGEISDNRLTAFYCTESRKIYITGETLSNVGNNYGPEGVATLVAHEYAHARLHAVQGFTRDVIWSSVIDEIQADCVAGVYLKNATPIQLTRSMVDNSADFIESVGDYLLLEKDWHGTPQMRRQSFLHGYNKGNLSACVASDNSNASKLIRKTSDTIIKQIDDPSSDLNRLIQWGNNLLTK